MHEAEQSRLGSDEGNSGAARRMITPIGGQRLADTPLRGLFPLRCGTRASLGSQSPPTGQPVASGLNGTYLGSCGQHLVHAGGAAASVLPGDNAGSMHTAYATSSRNLLRTG